MTRFRSPLRRRYLVAIGFSLAVLLHGFYDSFLFGFDSELWWLSLLGALPVMSALFGLKLRWALARSPEHPDLA